MPVTMESLVCWANWLQNWLLNLFQYAEEEWDSDDIFMALLWKKRALEQNSRRRIFQVHFIMKRYGAYYHIVWHEPSSISIVYIIQLCLSAKPMAAKYDQILHTGMTVHVCEISSVFFCSREGVCRVYRNKFFARQLRFQKSQSSDRTYRKLLAMNTIITLFSI